MYATAKISNVAQLQKNTGQFDKDIFHRTAMETLGFHSEGYPGWLILKFGIQSYVAACLYSFASKTPTLDLFE